MAEAIRNSDALLLLWSAAALQSEFVDFEWNTALALKKPILIVLHDETALPAALCALHGIAERRLEDVLRSVLESLQTLGLTVPDMAKGVVPARTLTPNNLPHQVTSFVGREHELAEVRKLLGETRLLTLPVGLLASGRDTLARQAPL